MRRSRARSASRARGQGSPAPARATRGVYRELTQAAARAAGRRPWAPQPTILPPARRIVVLPSRAMAGIPIEAILAPDDTRTVSYAPSGTVFKYLRTQPRPDRAAGLWPWETRSTSAPIDPPSAAVTRAWPAGELVAPGSNAATHGLRPGDVLLAYNGKTLKRRDDLKAVSESAAPIPVELWRDGEVGAARAGARKARRRG